MMSNTILTRAKRLDNGKFVEGYCYGDTMNYTKGGEQSQDKYDLKDIEYYIMDSTQFNNDLIDTETLQYKLNDTWYTKVELEDIVKVKSCEGCDYHEGYYCNWKDENVKDGDYCEDYQSKPDTLSIEHEAKKEHFAKFGFEVPEFECELLKTYKDKIIVGSANNPYISNDLIPLIWDTEGNCSDIEFNLTPLPIVEEAKPTKEELIKDKVDSYTKLLEWVIDYQGDLEGDWYICKPNHLWKMYNPINNGQPDTVMMKQETAEALCKALNDGSFSLHVELKKCNEIN